MSKKFTNANIAQRLAEKQKELQLQRDKTQLSAQSAKQQVTPVNTRFAVLKVNKPKKEAVKTESSTPSLATANVWQTDKEVESSNTPAKRAGVSGEPSWGDESEEMDFSEPLPGMHRNGEQTKTTISTQNTEPEHVVKQESVNTTPAIEPVESQTITNTDTPKPVPEALTEVSSNSQDFQSPQPYFSPHNAPVLVPVFVPPGKEEFPPYEPEGDEASSTSSFSTDIDRALEQNDSPQRHAKPTPADNSRTSNTDTKSTVFHSVHPSPPFKVLLRRAQPPPPDPTPLPMPAQVSTEVSSPVKIAARRPHNIHDPSIQPVAPPRNLGSVVENPHQAPSHFDNERTENRRRRGERDNKERAEPKQYPKPAPQFYTGQPIQIMSREPDSSKQKDMQAPINNNIQWSRPTPPPPDTTFFSSQPPPTEASKNPNKEGNNRRKGRGRGGKEDFKQSQPSGHNPQAHTHDGSSSEEEQTNRLPSRRRNKAKTGENPNGRNKPTPDHWQHDDRSPQKFEEENRRYVGPEVPSRGKKHKERPTPVDWEGFRTGSGWNQEQITRQEQGQRQETRHENSFRQDHYQRQDRQEHTQRHERQEYVRQEQSYRQDQRHETNPARHEQTHRQDNYKQEQVHKEKVQRQDQGHSEHQNQKKSNQTETPKESDRNQGRHNSEKQEQNANRNRDNRNTDNKHNRDKRKDTRHADEGQGHQRYDRYYENEPEQPRKWVQKSKT